MDLDGPCSREWQLVKTNALAEREKGLGVLSLSPDFVFVPVRLCLSRRAVFCMRETKRKEWRRKNARISRENKLTTVYFATVSISFCACVFWALSDSASNDNNNNKSNNGEIISIYLETRELIKIQMHNISLFLPLSLSREFQRCCQPVNHRLGVYFLFGKRSLLCYSRSSLPRIQFRTRCTFFNTQSHDVKNVI